MINLSTTPCLTVGILLILNLIAFCLFGLDKRKARHSQYRISEATLLWIAVLGGAIGAWLGMKVWHHKTLHKKFRYGIPTIIILHTTIALILGGALFLLDYSLNPAGKDERDARSMSHLRKHYHGTAEWVDSMMTVGKASSHGGLRDTFIINRNRRLHAYYASHPKAEGTAILVHGYTDNALRMMMLGKLYYDTLHYNILIPEHERHGKSEGEIIQMGWFDRLNLERWISVANNLWKGDHIFLHGISMGAATVMMCSGDNLPASVKGIIEDCGYTSVWDEFSGEIRNQFHLPIHPLMDIASFICKIKYGWSFQEASALEQVRHSTIPMLFIHGDSDTFVPTSMVYQLYRAKVKGYKRLWVVPNTTHARAYNNQPLEYRRQITSFVDACN